MNTHEKALARVALMFPPPFTRPHGVVNEYLHGLVDDDAAAVIVLAGGRMAGFADVMYEWLGHHEFTSDILDAARRLAEGSS